MATQPGDHCPSCDMKVVGHREARAAVEAAFVEEVEKRISCRPSRIGNVDVLVCTARVQSCNSQGLVEQPHLMLVESKAKAAHILLKSFWRGHAIFLGDAAIEHSESVVWKGGRASNGFIFDESGNRVLVEQALRMRDSPGQDWRMRIVAHEFIPYSQAVAAGL